MYTYKLNYSIYPTFPFFPPTIVTHEQDLIFCYIIIIFHPTEYIINLFSRTQNNNCKRFIGGKHTIVPEMIMYKVHFPLERKNKNKIIMLLKTFPMLKQIRIGDHFSCCIKYEFSDNI